MVNVPDFVEINPHIRIAANKQSDTPITKLSYFDERAIKQLSRL